MRNYGSMAVNNAKKIYLTSEAEFAKLSIEEIRKLYFMVDFTR